MKKSSLIFLVLTLFSGAFIYYLMYHGDGGADGLSTFIPLVFTGVLFICFLLAFLLSLFLGKGQSTKTRSWIIGIAIALPVLGFLSVSGVFSYFTYDYQNQWKIQVESDKSVLSTLQFKDEDFGVTFNHVSGNISLYENGTPIPTPITPYVENERLIVPVDDETYLEPDVLIKLKDNKAQALSAYLEDLNVELNLDVKFKKGAIDDFPELFKDTQIFMLGEDVSYEKREKLGKYILPGKTGQSDLIYFFKHSKQPENIWALIVSSKVSSTSATVEKMSTSNFEDGNLWFHTLEFTD